MPTNHLSTIKKLSESRGGSGARAHPLLKAKSSGEQREETNDGRSSDYSDLDDDDAAFLGNGEDDDSDVDEDESRMEASDPKSDTSLMLPSCFVNLPPTVWLPYAKFADRKREELRGPQAGFDRTYELTEEKLLPLFFRSNHTIICLGGALKRSGFRRLLKGNTYNVFWGHHLKEAQLQKLHPKQYVNHFPGSYTLGRKDYLWKNISRQARQHPQAYDFCAKSYVLPRDRELLTKDYKEGDVYIVKPPASAEGRGIRLVNRMAELPRAGQPAVVQQYISRPHLINNKKYDCRIYVAVTSFDPLRAYMYEEGLARFATQDYTLTAKSIRDRYMHLTNYSVNKRSDDFVKNEDADCDNEGSKWSLTAWYKYMEQEVGVDVVALKARIRDIIIKTLIAGEATIVSKTNSAGRPSCFELFGFDVLLDEALKPWVIEVNVACSLASSSPLDRRIKHFMMTDLLHLVGINPWDRKVTKKEDQKPSWNKLAGEVTSKLKRMNVFELQATPLKDLGPEDLEIVAIAEDENQRSGGWERIFPNDLMLKTYLPLFEFPRYRNTVLAKWFDKPDWSLLAPMLSPSLPADHEFRRLAAEPRPRTATDLGEAGSKATPVKSRLAAAADEARKELRRRQLEQQQLEAEAAAAGADVEAIDVEAEAEAAGAAFIASARSKPPMAIGCTTGAPSAACAQAVTSAAGAGAGAAVVACANAGGSVGVLEAHCAHNSSRLYELSMGYTQPSASVLGATQGSSYGMGASSELPAGSAEQAVLAAGLLSVGTNNANAGLRAASQVDTSMFASRLHQLMRRTDASLQIPAKPPTSPEKPTTADKQAGRGLTDVSAGSHPSPTKVATPLMPGRLSATPVVAVAGSSPSSRRRVTVG